MTDAIGAVSSSLEALGREYQAVAHNLANVSTVGYKRRCHSFIQMLRQHASDADAGSPAAQVQALSAASVLAKPALDMTAGAMTQTGRSLDLAIESDGFFVVETEGGPLYTRCGVFRTDGNGKLVDADGRGVAGENGQLMLPAEVPSEQINVAADGTVRAGGTAVGKLKIVRFDQPGGLLPAGGRCLAAPPGLEPQPADSPRVLQGYQEASNVNAVEELVSLITLSRLYEANLKSIQAQDERMKEILQVAMA